MGLCYTSGPSHSSVDSNPSSQPAAPTPVPPPLRRSKCLQQAWITHQWNSVLFIPIIYLVMLISPSKPIAIDNYSPLWFTLPLKLPLHIVIPIELNKVYYQTDSALRPNLYINRLLLTGANPRAGPSTFTHYLNVWWIYAPPLYRHYFSYSLNVCQL